MRKRRAGLPLSRERGRVKRIANMSIPFPRKRESSINIARKSGKQRASPPFSKITLQYMRALLAYASGGLDSRFRGRGKGVAKAEKRVAGAEKRIEDEKSESRQ